MKLHLESTQQIVDLSLAGPIGEIAEGIKGLTGRRTQGRVWIGKTDAGVPVQALILSVAVQHGYPQAEFDRELVEVPAPAPSPAAFPLRMIL